MKTIHKNRCNCNSGECTKCWLDFIDQQLIDNPNWRECYCGSKYCGACNYYKKLEKFILYKDYKYETKN